MEGKKFGCQSALICHGAERETEGPKIEEREGIKEGEVRGKMTSPKQPGDEFVQHHFEKDESRQTGRKDRETCL